MSGGRDSDDIDAEAARWVIRLDGRTPTAAEQRSLEQWLDQDVRHLGAYARARAIYMQFDQMRMPASPTRPDTPSPVNAPQLTRRRLLLWAAGGGLAAGVAGVTLLGPRSVQEYSTRIGEMRREPLPDGSTVTLNTGTTLAVAYTERLRHVQLMRGEVLIEAAPDPARLFTLTVLGTQITTASAAFAVRLLSREGLQVMVQNGQIQVFEPSSPFTPVTLPANTLALPRTRPERGQARKKLVTEPIDAAEVERRLAWQRGQLSFEDVTLDSALREFARYGAVRVVIDDPSIAGLKVVGLYSAADPIGFAKAVAISLGLRLEMQAGVAHLKPPDPPGNPAPI
jgi:transmembrane sensor